MRKNKIHPYKPKWDSALNRDLSDAEIKKLADQMLEWITDEAQEGKNPNFWLNDFAAGNMLTPADLSKYSSLSEYFSKIYSICKLIQESKLLKMALYKEVNATPAVFILKSVIGTGETEIPADFESAKKQIEEIFEE